MTPETPDRKDVQRFQSAVDNRLACLREDPFLAKRIIANETREKKVKKRMSLGLVLALTVIMAATAVLAENWSDISEYLASGLPDRITQPSDAGSEDGKAEGTVIQRHVIEPVYAPVRVHVVNDAGEETCAFDLTPQVAQVAYRYTILYRTDKTWGLEPDIVIEAANRQDLNQAMNPFAPYLFCSGKLVSSGYHVFAEQYNQLRIDFTAARYTLSYAKEIYLNEQGMIVRTVQDDLTLNLGLVDDNGKLSENCFEAAAQRFAYSEDGDPLEPALSFSPSVETTPLPRRSPTAMNYGRLEGEYANSLRFGLPYTLHYQDKDGNPQELHIDTCENMFAGLLQEETADGSDLGGKNGEVLTEYGLLILANGQSNVDITFQRLAMPTVTAAYDEGGCTVHIVGGKFRVKYPTDVYHDIEAWQDYNGAWHYTPTSENFLYAEYAEGEYPYDFTFRLEELPESAGDTK